MTLTLKQQLEINEVKLKFDHELHNDIDDLQDEFELLMTDLEITLEADIYNLRHDSEIKDQNKINQLIESWS